MSKKGNRFSEADLIAMGMKETFPGSGIYEPKKKVVDNFNGRDRIPLFGGRTIAVKNPMFEKIVDTLSVKNNEQFKANPISEWFIPHYQVPSSKNSYTTFIDENSKSRMITGKNIREYKSVTKMYWQIFGAEFRKAIEYYKLQFPLNVKFTFIRKTNQRFDYINVLQTIQDIMADEEFNWIPDDDTKHLKPSFGDVEINKQNPGVRIKLIL